MPHPEKSKQKTVIQRGRSSETRGTACRHYPKSIILILISLIIIMIIIILIILILLMI